MSMLPVNATIRQPSWVERRISIGPPPGGGRTAA
jgi:hypothetical protein